MGITTLKPEPISLISLLLGSQAIVGTVDKTVDVTTSEFLTNNWIGSGGSSSGHYLDMLEFSALHSIAPQCEPLPVAKIADAINKVRR